MGDDIHEPAVLLTEASDYIGGIILHRFMNHESFANGTISVLIRSEDRAAKLKEVYGERIRCILFADLNEVDLIEMIASQHDIVINAASGFHMQSALAMVKSLAKRKTAVETDVWMIHTSGCSNISDRPITGTSYPDREWDDADPLSIYEFERAEESREPYIQRTAELTILESAELLGVKTVSIQGTAVYGVGEGLWQRAGLIVPIMARFVLENGHAFNVGDGSGVIDKVQVSDLADLYLLLLEKIMTLGGKAISTGKFVKMCAADNVRLPHVTNAQNALDAALEAGKVSTKEIRTVTLAEAAKTTAGLEEIAETGWAGHRLTKSSAAYQLGWRPRNISSKGTRMKLPPLLGDEDSTALLDASPSVGPESGALDI